MNSLVTLHTQRPIQALCGVLGVMLLSMGACTPQKDGGRQDTGPDLSLSQEQVTPSPVHSNQPVERWLFIGDSLTAGYGLSRADSYVAVLENQLQRGGWRGVEGKRLKLINAGVSGDTSAGVLRRIDWLLEDGVTRAFICIGANDGLRGQPIEQLRDNLKDIINRVHARGVKVTLMGMKIPPNYGVEYTQAFERVYGEVASELKVPLLPFLLEGVAGDPTLNLADGIHPNREGQRRVADHVFTFIRDQSLVHFKERAVP